MGHLSVSELSRPGKEGDREGMSTEEITFTHALDGVNWAELKADLVAMIA